MTLIIVCKCQCQPKVFHKDTKVCIQVQLPKQKLISQLVKQLSRVKEAPWLKMSKKVDLAKIPLVGRGTFKIKVATPIFQKMLKLLKSKNQFHLQQQLTHKMCVKMGMIPSSLRMC